MSLKTLFCNKSIVKADLKRFWWIGAVYTLLMFLFYTFNFLQRFYNGNGTVRVYVDYSSSYIYNYGVAVFVLALIVPVICGVLLFSYMQSGSPSTFAHSIPVTRKQNYISHLVSGFVLILAPHIINTIIFLVCRFDKGFADTFKITHLLTVMYTGIIYALVAFSIASFMSFVAGNSVAGIVFSYVLGYLPLAVEFFIKEFLGIQLFGYPNGTALYFVAKYIYIAPGYFTQIKYIIYYLILAMVFFVLGYLVYKIRNLENHSEVVAFPKIKPLFIYGVAVAFGCIGYFYFYGVFQFKSALYLIPFGVVGIIVAQMVAQKTFRVKRAVLKSLIAYSLCVVALFVIFNFDVFGYERKIPSANNVESIVYDLNINNDRGYMYLNDGSQIKTGLNFEPVIKDKDAVHDVIKLHRVLTENKDNILNNFNKSYSYNDTPINLTYKLKNGKTLKRKYNINYYQFKEYINNVADNDEAKLSYFPLLRDRDITIEKVNITDSRINGDNLIATLYGNDAKLLLESLKKDLKNANASDYAPRGETFVCINLIYKPSAYYDDGKPVEQSKINTFNENYYIRSSYINTMALIKDYEQFAKAYKAEDIDKIGVLCYEPVFGEIENKEIQLNGEYEKFNNVIDNPETISKIYEYLKNNGTNRMYSNGYIKIILKDGSWYNYDFSAYDTEFVQLLGLR